MKRPLCFEFVSRLGPDADLLHDLASFIQLGRNVAGVGPANVSSAVVDRVQRASDVILPQRDVRERPIAIGPYRRFAPPPKGGQLVMVRRRINNPVDPPTVGDYRAALLGKHGKPDIDKSGSPIWLQPRNAVNCTGSAAEDVAGILSSIYMGSGQIGWRLNELRNAKKVREPSQCARMLEYRMLSSPNQPATTVTALLVDVPGWGTAYLATLGWIEDQRQAAVKAREGAASKPRL